MEYLSRNATGLPILNVKDNASINSNLVGSFYLKVTQVVDISKPSQDMSSAFLDLDDENEDLDETEEDTGGDDHTVKRLKGKYATKGAGKKEILKKGPRMLQLDLRDQHNTLMRAIELKPIDRLNVLKPNSVIHLLGPMEIRCSNILLESHNVGSIIPIQ